MVELAMFEFNSRDYRNFTYGIVPKKFLARKKKYVFTIWDEELILFWNGGQVRCFRNACPHYGLPLNQGKLLVDQVHCSFHGWQFSLSDGRIIKAPYAKKMPNCGLKGYKAFVKGGIVFVYLGDEEYFEEAQRYIPEDVLEDPASTWIDYETPFYLAMNSTMDKAHLAFHFHSIFYTLHGLYRFISGEKDPLLTGFSQVMIEETENFFKYKIPEVNAVSTTYPFCNEYDDLTSLNKWQVFVSPISKTKSRYFLNISAGSKNPLFRAITYFAFHTIVSHVAAPEDKGWLKGSYRNWQSGINLNLCDYDFGLKVYLRKFFISSSKSQCAIPEQGPLRK
jgi:phenylpropionate dioxygenase-like ring-hydroxylating dioxygenase large terminal subunit